MSSHSLLDWLQFWKGYEGEFGTLLLYVLGIALFVLVIYGFYQNICRKSLVASDRGDGSVRLGRVLRFIALFPLMSFGFFLALSVSIFFLTKTPPGEVQTAVGQTLLISVAVVAAVRVTAYINESASHDLAKLVPLAVLGVALVAPGFLDAETFLLKLQELWARMDLVLRYLVAIILLEVVLKLAYAAYLRVNPPVEDLTEVPHPAGDAGPRKAR